MQVLQPELSILSGSTRRSGGIATAHGRISTRRASGDSTSAVRRPHSAVVSCRIPHPPEATAGASHSFRFRDDDYRTGTSARDRQRGTPQSKRQIPAQRLLSVLSPTMSDRETFGPRLRSERERRGITLDTIASVTKVNADLWDGLERNDFSRWPSGVFARAFVRDYARAIGVDADEVVEEFCRLFPIGDRRANRLIKAQAELIGHQLAYAEPGGIPPQGDRRAPRRARNDDSRANRAKYGPRVLALAVDASCTLGLSACVNLLLSTGFWSSAGVLSLLYYGITTVMLGGTPGLRVASALVQRMPTLFAMQDRRRVAA